MQVKLALLADYANVTAEGKLNILGIFDRISANQIAAVHPQMHLILRLEADPAERDRPHNIEIRLYDSDGQIVLEVKVDVVPHGQVGETIASNKILTLNNLQLDKADGYTFVLLVNNDLKSELPLGVKLYNPAFTPPPGDIAIH